MPPKIRSDDQERSFIEQARRRQIVRAAIETIAEVGFGNASFAKIAARAGISAGLISYHFAGKDELVRQVVADISGEMAAAIEERAHDARDYTDGLRAVITGFVHYTAEHRTEMYALQAISTGGGPSEAVDREASVAELADMLREGQQHREFRAFDADLMAVTLNAALEAIPHQLYGHPDTDVDTYAEELAETFARAVRRGRGDR